MRIAATLVAAGLLVAAGSSTPVTGAAEQQPEPRIEACIQPAGDGSAGDCGADRHLGRVQPHQPAPQACIMPAVYRGGPLELCLQDERTAPSEPEIVPLRR